MPETHVVLADLHIPFHDEKALAVAHKVARAAKPDCIWWLGDVLDFAPISRFRDSARYSHTVQDELDEAVAYFQRTRRQFPGVPFHYMLGNHEHRLKYYLWVQAAHLRDLRAATFEHQFMFDCNNNPINLDITFHKKKYLLARRFVLKHGSRANLYSVRWEYEDEGRSGMSAHMHRSGSWAWSRPGTGGDMWHGVGCLCDLDPKYKEDDGKPSPWNHGMAVLTKDGNHVSVENVIIEKGVAGFRGRTFTA